MVGVIARIVAMLGFRPALWYPDSFQYVGVALRMQPYPVRPVGYSGLLALLDPFGGFTLVVAVQHLMGLAVAGLLYALLLRRNLPGWLAGLAVTPALVDGNLIQIEHLIQSEALFAFLLTGGLTALLWRRRPSWASSCTAGALLAFATLVRPISLAVIALAAAYLLRRGGWRTVAACSIAATVPLLAYGLWFQNVHGRFGLSTSGGVFLYARVAAFADCRRVDPPEHLQVLCEPEPPAQRSSARRYVWSRSPLDHLPGVDPEARMPAERVAPVRSGPAGEFARRVILAQPEDYLRASLRDFARTFSWTRQPYPTPGDVAVYRFSRSPLAIPRQRGYVEGGTALDDTTAYHSGPADTRLASPYADLIITYQKVAVLRGPVLAVLLVLGAVSLVALRSRDPDFDSVLLLWLTSMFLLLAPPFLVLFNHRYVLPAIPLVAPTAAWCLWHYHSRRRARRTTAPGLRQQAT